MKRPILAILAAFTALFSGCASITLQDHYARVAAKRRALPAVYQLSGWSMQVSSPQGGPRMVYPKAFKDIQSGDWVVYWPYGQLNPIAHTAWKKIALEAWECRGENQPGDLTLLGTLCTPENYIGVIK